jgi:3-oxoacyl-[acyl-carrier protein] reductase
VTGASRGIGAAIARQLAEAGWPVAIGYSRDREGAERTASEIRCAGGRAEIFAGDLGQPETPDRLVRDVRGKLGEVGVLVNNAGVRADALLGLMTDDEWRQVMATNLHAPFRLARAVMRPMLRRHDGRIVNIASTVGIAGSAGQTNYAASKAGLIALTRSLAVEVARHGITVNAVAPGQVATRLTSDVPTEWARSIPAGRVGTADEVAACVRFLASAEAAYVNGAVLTVDGGLTA